jgi:NTP pyrophosphatase (non-canonical NTP hydrolase)
MKEEEIYLKALEKWGALAQMEMAQEEATELALAIRKQVRNNNEESFKNLVDEIADVEIMIEQLKIIHNQNNLRENVELRKAFKIERLEKRINI